MMNGPGGPEQAARSQGREPPPPRRPVRSARRPVPVRAAPQREPARGPVSPRLFQLREPPRHFGAVTVLVIALHVAIVAWAIRARVTSAKPAPEPVKVALKLPIRKVPVNEPPGGAPKRPPPARPHVR